MFSFLHPAAGWAQGIAESLIPCPSCMVQGFCLHILLRFFWFVTCKGRHRNNGCLKNRPACQPHAPAMHHPALFLKLKAVSFLSLFFLPPPISALFLCFLLFFRFPCMGVYLFFLSDMGTVLICPFPCAGISVSSCLPFPDIPHMGRLFPTVTQRIPPYPAQWLVLYRNPLSFHKKLPAVYSSPACGNVPTAFPEYGYPSY